jgi:predicted house-cleaning NTP pyrophosphatase (Maf/HAM1 superfamily)
MQIFAKNANFCKKCKFLQKMQIFAKNANFCKKCKFLQKMRKFLHTVTSGNSISGEGSTLVKVLALFKVAFKRACFPSTIL